MTRGWWFAGGLVALAAGLLWQARDRDALVVYCATDAHLAEPILEAFTMATGIRLHVVHDTEATKTLGLIERIVAERDNPRCDVLWCNEPLGAMRLHGLGLLAPHRGAGFARIPDAWKDPEGHWVGFAARLRVWIAGGDLTHARSKDLDAALTRGTETRDLGWFALAVPLWGTTRFHVTALWALRGRAPVEAWFAGLRAAGARFVRGNAAVKDLVAAGAARLGFTDTDDAFAAPAGLGIVPVEIDGRVLCMPNTVAVVAGTRRRAQAEALVDHLLSADTEVALARGPGRQIPLGEVAMEDLPEPVAALRELIPRAVPMALVQRAQADALAWLAAEWRSP